MPFSGGGYMRMMPKWFIRYGIRKNNAEGVPVIFYVHPWEFDPGQPHIRIKATSRFRHYTNLEYAEERLRGLLSRFKFTSLGDLIQHYPVTQQWPNFSMNGADGNGQLNTDSESVKSGVSG